MILVRYFVRLFTLWTAWVFTVLELVTLAINLLSPQYSLPTSLYWLIAGSGFVIANFHLFINLDRRISELEALEPEIVLKVHSANVTWTAPILILSGRYEDGLNAQGLPIAAHISAEVELENLGREVGEFLWRVDLTKSSLPDGFLVFQNQPNGEFAHYDGILDGRARWQGHWCLHLGTPSEDPEAFARDLRNLKSFQFTLAYRTKRIGGQSRQRIARVKGDFTGFRSALIQQWEKRGLTHLVSLAEDSN